LRSSIEQREQAAKAFAADTVTEAMTDAQR
jgi:hypothetical protein